MSKLEQFFELVGVQPEVDFKLKRADTGEPVHSSDGLYFFDYEGNLRKCSSSGCCFPEYIPRILSGEFEIVLEPFKPREGGRYWYLDTSGELNVTSYSHSCIVDVSNFLIGNCFPAELVSDDNRREIGYKFEKAGVDVSGWKL